MIRHLFFVIVLIASLQVVAQRPSPGGGRNLMQNMPGGFSNMGGGRGGFGSGSSSGPFKDSLLHRTGFEDSATIAFRYLDTARFFFMDSSVNDFTKRWYLPWTNVFLGNTGSATRSLLFSPNMQAGWDHGMHAYDPYIQKIKDVKFYNTTRPFTQLNYVLGSRQEQNITVFHTQNIRYNWNFSFRYNLINAPGIFRNQLNNHNNYLFNSWYIAPRKRYSAFFVLSANKIAAYENGGIVNNRFLDSLPSFGQRLSIPTNLGGTVGGTQALFGNTINTGNRYNVTNWLLRQHYDVGKKDSVVTDSTVSYLFYPRLRFQHTFQYTRYQFDFSDATVDTAGYRKLYGLTNLPSKFGIRDFWQIIDNEFALYSFPDSKNQQQFLKVAAGIQNLNADFGVNTTRFSNLYLKGEYRNRTRNKKWDMELAGTFYSAGEYIGDYQVNAALSRLIGNKTGILTLRFSNVNRTPSFVHDDRSNFKKLNIGNTDFNKENTTIAGVQYDLPQKQLSFGANYFLAGNYIYFKNTFQAEQESTLFNVLQLFAQKKFRITKKWNWYAEAFVQQATPNAPVNLPLVFTRNRIAYEGRFFKNLNLSTGLEMRYHTAFKADGYSPVLGQFYLQNDTTIRNLPDISAYLHFRIRSMYWFIRAENLNAVQVSPSFGFYNNNLATPTQPMPGLFIRFGIYWGFVN